VIALPFHATPLQPLHAAFISSFVPRECGLATFTEDVINAVSAHGVVCKVIAMDRPGQVYHYDRRVIATVQENRLTDYVHAADVINRGRYQILSVQHEYGIFGGETCFDLAEFLKLVNVPVVTTLHTILRKPSPAMRRNLRLVADRSAAIVVMNELAVGVLEAIYGIEPGKIAMVHHGAPVIPATRRQLIKEHFNLHDRRIISTFGLLSSGKGLEYAIQAMPSIVAAYPNALYLILGQTHPVVKQQEGERYRDALKTLADALGVRDHVMFVDKYFTKAELVAFLLATDIYLTPYLNMEQVTSGTLAYAMACGRPLVSTPYLYAQYLLGEDRGLLVPPCDPGGIADACRQIFASPELRAGMERANWHFGKAMLWPAVGREYMRLFHGITALHAAQATPLQARAG